MRQNSEKNIPVDVTFHPRWWHKHARICFNTSFFRDWRYRLRADLIMRQTLYEKFGDLGLGEQHPQERPILGSDLIAAGFLHSEILGCEVIYSDPDPPVVLCRNLDAGNAGKLTIPDLNQSEVWKNIERQIDELLEKFGHVSPCINLMGVQNIAYDVRGQELFTDYYSNPELAHHLGTVITRNLIQIGDRFKKLSPHISSGVTANVARTVPDAYCTSNCSVEMVSLDIYESFLLHYDQWLARHFKSFGIHHCGQSMEHVVQGYARVENLHFAEVGAFSNIEHVRKYLPECFLNIRYSPVSLKNDGAAEMKRNILAMLNGGKPLNLLSISCVGIDDATSDDQVRNFILTCRDVESEIRIAEKGASSKAELKVGHAGK